VLEALHEIWLAQEDLGPSDIRWPPVHLVVWLSSDSRCHSPPGLQGRPFPNRLMVAAGLLEDPFQHRTLTLRIPTLIRRLCTARRGMRGNLLPRPWSTP